MSEFDRGDGSRDPRVERIYTARDVSGQYAASDGLPPAYTQDSSAGAGASGSFSRPAAGTVRRSRAARRAQMETAPAAPRITTYDQTAYAPNEEDPYVSAPHADAYAPLGAGYDETAYTPNEEVPPAIDPFAPYDAPYGDAQDEAPTATVDEPSPKPDYSAYYRAREQDDSDLAEPAYAPPTKLSYETSRYKPFQSAMPTDDMPEQAGGANVYRPREATWADTARHEALSVGDVGYQVSDAEPEKPRKKHGVRNLAIVGVVVALLGGAGYLWREPLGELFTKLTGGETATEAPFTAVTTPAPVRGFDAAPAVEISQAARQEISALAGTLDMQTDAVTERSVLTRSPRADGLNDYYLFSAEGKLLCYFEGLPDDGMIPVDGGGFYVKQAPYLVNADGSAMFSLSALENDLRTTLVPGEPLRGMCVVSDETRGAYNYLSTDGTLLTSLWFSRAYPFTGEYTAAYVDTGVDGDERYMLYALSADAGMTKLWEAPDMSDVVASACGAMYMKTGELIRLDNPSEPMLATSDVAFYPDCDAMVIAGEADPETGARKYGLYVGCEQRYGFFYDEIKPVECDIEWAQKTYGADAGKATVRVVNGASYPQPLTHYFELTRDGQKEYVALSTVSSCPILLDGQP